ncbi:MAG: type VII secretion protein EccCb, partial [Propionibacteriaceae bacterium]|nr:type VII secretion protein EccCb [Propionibacteriaceae bacterium]
ILSLATAHSPQDLSMILIDYKGGAAFSPFAPLPHLAGLIDNLADDPQLTVRARASLQGEVVRRQQQLKEADSSPSITHYRELRRTRPELPPMPHLFVVIDEFGELLTAEPDFIDLFLQIGRIGRSIGVHLLLSSQRIEGGKLRGLDTYLSYRLGLRTFSESESQVVLATADAFHLPPLPGYGYLKVDTSVYQRFRAGFVSGPMPRGVRQETVSAGPRIYELPVYNGIDVDEDDPGSPVLRHSGAGRTLVEEVVAGLRADDTAVPPVWLPPLPNHITLGQVLEATGESPLHVVVGLEDDPARQRQHPWVLDLTRSGGHIAIIGGPQTGRTTLLRTVAASLSLQATPRQVAIYGMDLSGGGLRRIESFPHVGGVATRGDTDRLRRLIEELTAMLRAREQLFKSHGIDSMSQLRTMHARGQLPQLASADIVLLVDGYGILRSDFDALEDAFTRLMLQASSYGLHLVMTMTRWGELRMAHQSLFGTRIELRLNDSVDSIIDRKLAATIPSDTPGRALTDHKNLTQVALPSLEFMETEDVGDALEALAQQVAESWSGPTAAPIRLLPNHLTLEELPPHPSPGAVPLGLRQDTMDTALWDLEDGDQHLLVLGDAKCGKSTTLRALARGLISRFNARELAIAVVDPRGHVPGVIPDDYLAAHATTQQQASALANSIATELAQRPTRTPQEQRKAPRIVVLVDDHDIISAGGVEPLAPLVPFLPAARDLGLHVVVARPVAGASRALYGTFLQSLRDTGGATLLMSGDRSEGQVLPRITPERMPPGRGRYLRRGEPPYIVQVAEVPRPEAAG